MFGTLEFDSPAGPGFRIFGLQRMTKPNRTGLMISSLKPLPTLKKRAQFLALRQGVRFHCDVFILQGHLKQSETGFPSIGYTVTKKIGNSVERNRIRRRLRQAIAEAVANKLENRDNKARHGGYSGEMVVVARRSAIDESYHSLVNKFTKGIDRLLAKGNKAG